MSYLKGHKERNFAYKFGQTLFILLFGYYSMKLKIKKSHKLKLKKKKNKNKKKPFLYYSQRHVA